MEASLKARALRHLARREHTRAELERKLRASVERAARMAGADRTGRAHRDERGERGDPSILSADSADSDACIDCADAAGRAAQANAHADRIAGPARRSDATSPAAAAPPALDDTPLADQIREALDDLAARGLLDDARAAESLLATQGARLGQRRLRQVLVARGLAPDLVRETLQQSGATEFERARDLWLRRFGETPADAKAAARQTRFLAGRGFDAEVIRRVMKLARSPESED